MMELETLTSGSSATEQSADTAGRSLLIVLWSGGLDSTLCAYKALRETEFDVHLHHIRLINHSGRNSGECHAVRQILPMLMAIRPFSYTESTLDFSCLHPSGCDEDVCTFVAAKLVESEAPRYGSVVVWEGSNADDWNSPFLRLRYSKRGHQQKFWRHLCWRFDTVPLDYPIGEMTKQEVWDGLPDEIRKLTWSCRKPVDGLHPCGECVVCKERIFG